MPEGYRHLTCEQRCQIYALLQSGHSQAHIARAIGVDPSTISRELVRNTGARGYRFKQAHEKASQRRKEASDKPRKMTPDLVELIEEKLTQEQWSPDQISGRLAKDGVAFISHERIYQHVWKDKKDGGALHLHLRHSGKKYNKRKGKNSGRGLIPNRVDIDQRPSIVAAKSRIGDCGPLVAGTAPPVVLATLNPKILNVPALEALAPKVPGLEPHVVPGGTENVPSEEVRHNEVTFNHIFCNKLYTKAGLRMAFASGQPISFPIDSIEVKANWKPAGNRNPSEFYMNTASDGKRYALVSMHIISKRVPNWTWATFEQKDNPGRCDFIGCQDHFGATTPDVDSNPTPGGRYNPCIKTPAVKKVFMDAGMPALWDNYCLKGSQVDFTTATGVTTRLGNSVTEDGFVETSSCMTCHSRSAVGATGRWVYGPGFITSPNPAICPPPPGQTACSPNGAPNPAWFLNNLGQANQSLLALQTDFVFSIARFAIGQ